jgi:plasmid maintenance system antidote protein VapI
MTAKPPKAPSEPAVDDQLREAINADDRTPYRLAALSGVDERIIRRFASGERDITMGTAARLARVLGLTLAPSRRRRG